MGPRASKRGPGDRKFGEEQVAAKHDAKKARANFWVMQQNLAKQKGGRPGYKFNEKKLPKPAKSAVVPASSEAPKVDAGATEDPASATGASADDAAT